MPSSTGLLAILAFCFYLQVMSQLSQRAVAGREQTFLPPQDAEALAAIEQLLGGGEAPLVLSSTDTSLDVPDELRSLLSLVVSSLRRGKAITVAPHALRLTTQEAADMLGISRPTLIKLLEDGHIPYETPSRHRRIHLIDLLNYQALRRSERRAALDELAADAQELGLYDQAPASYEASLAQARRKLA
jgi:excisionase family DNA binding protein